jgi:hypothetical protein
LLDDLNNDGGLGSGWGTISSVADAVVAPSSNALLQPGDLIVLVGDSYGDFSSKPVVVRYPQTAIPTCSSEIGCGQVLVTEAGLPLSGGTQPVSIDISPVDGSLLIATSDGSIWQLPIVSSGEFTFYGTPTLYACVGKSVNNVCVTGTGVAWGKIRATQQSGNLFVVATVTQSESSAGFVGLFAGTPPLQGPVQSVFVPNTQPVGLAIPFYRTGTTLAAQCIATPENPLPNCDPLGDGVQLITIRGNTGNIPPGATITEQECVVAADPRIQKFGTCTGHTLNLKDVCPGLSDSTVIPDYMCGAGGVSNPGSGFVIIAALAEQVAKFSDGIEVRMDATSVPRFPVSPVCPQNVKLYTSNDHSMFETTFVEGHLASEWLAFCDPSGSLGPHKTIDGIGLVLNLTSFAPNGTPTQQAVKFADYKFRNLFATIQQSSIRYFWEKIVLLAGTAIAQRLVDIGHYDCSAELVYLLDQFARRHRADFLPLFTPTVREPNPFGDVTGRLANLYLTIENRIEGKAVTWTDWPLMADPKLCHTNECHLSGMDK